MINMKMAYFWSIAAIKARNAIGMLKCPKCGKSRIEVKVVERSAGQHDGIEGIVARCRTCGHQWLVDKFVPIV